MNIFIISSIKVTFYVFPDLERLCKKVLRGVLPKKLQAFVDSKRMYSAHRAQNSAIPSERLNDLFEQMKSEYVAMENELNLCKMQRDNFEQKCLHFYVFYFHEYLQDF